MSFFQCFAPERRSGHQIFKLPALPNEIYLQIFYHVVPHPWPYSEADYETFTRLASVCKFFANVFLARIYEHMTCYGSGVPEVDAFEYSPFILTGFKTTKGCSFIGWEHDMMAPSVNRFRLPEICVYTLSCMVNLREVAFTVSCVGIAHWNAFKMLESLEELSFVTCKFLGGPADIEPHNWVKLKVLRLSVTDCQGNGQPVAAIDPRYLRTLTTDYDFVAHDDWLSQSDLRELDWCCAAQSRARCIERLRRVLFQAPKSLEAIRLAIFPSCGVDVEMVGRVFDNLRSKNLPLLRSLVLQIHPSFLPREVISSTLQGVGRLATLQSFTLESHPFNVAAETEILCMLQDKIGTASNLKQANIEWTFHVVDGEWERVDPPSET